MSDSPAPVSSASLPQFPLELSDADATLQVHAAIPHAVDTEQELSETDLEDAELEVGDIVVEVGEPIVTQPTVIVARPLPRPSLPPPSFRRSASSIGPMAMDLGALPPPSRRRADSTVLLPRIQDNRDKRLYALVAAAATLAVVGLGSLMAAVVTSSRGAASAVQAPAQARVMTTQLRVAAPKEKELFTSVAVLAPSATPTSTSTSTSTPTSNPTSNPTSTPTSNPTSTSTPALASTSTPSVAATLSTAKVASSSKTGTLRVPPSIHGMLVDGRPRRVDGSTVVSCGRHTVKTGIAPSRVVEVPCGGTAWL